MLNIKKACTCQYDLLSLGEVMLRFDPNSSRIRNARSFDVYEGGAEYNVARGISSCFGLRSAVVTSLVDNEIGKLLKNLIRAGGVDLSFLKWEPFDSVGRLARNGINFTERGFGVRPALGVSDRGYTAISKMKPNQINWEEIFGEKGVRWFHTGGVFAALSDCSPEIIIEALKIAKKYNTITSYDLNYRESLWNSFGGLEKCQEVNKNIAKYVDVMIGNEEDFSKCLGLKVEGISKDLSCLPFEGYSKMIEEAKKQFPNFKVIATTLRLVKTASRNDWSALCWYEGKLFESTKRNDLEVLDRVGGGDSFASGLIYGFLESMGAQKAVEYGAANGALAMTTPGDTTFAIKSEVEELVAGKAARIKR